MKLPRTALAVLAPSLLMVVTLAPVLAATDNSKYVAIYNTINNNYTSLQHIAAAHDGWAKSHHTNCAGGQARKWWEKRYPKDVKAVSGAEKKLKTVANKHKRTYSDFVKAFGDLVHWMNGQLEPKLDTCKLMSKKSAKFEADLQAIQADLGIIKY